MIENSSTHCTDNRDGRKRKFSDSSSESDEASSEDEKRVEKESGKQNVKDKSKIENYENQIKKKLKIKSSKIPRIKDTCDCRFCYEDHIIRMRLKTERTWLNFL